MKLLYDFFPIILFFAAYKTYDIFVATAVAILASVLQVALYWLKNKRFERMHLISMGLIVVLGGMTLVLRDKTFIMWKPTVLNWLFALVFAASHFIGKKPLIERMLGEQIELPKPVWTRLSISWVLFFILSGVANIYVAFNYSENTWVNFKLFGLLGLTFIFIIGQGFYLMKHMPQTEAEEGKPES